MKRSNFTNLDLADDDTNVELLLILALLTDSGLVIILSTLGRVPSIKISDLTKVPFLKLLNGINDIRGGSEWYILARMLLSSGWVGVNFAKNLKVAD